MTEYRYTLSCEFKAIFHNVPKEDSDASSPQPTVVRKLSQLFVKLLQEGLLVLTTCWNFWHFYLLIVQEASYSSIKDWPTYRAKDITFLQFALVPILRTPAIHDIGPEHQSLRLKFKDISNRQILSCFHRGRAETAYRQPCSLSFLLTIMDGPYSNIKNSVD